MNYADIVKQLYPEYVLTKVGSGSTYEELEWSAFNPSPNPIPKVTLDNDLNNYIANNYSGAVGDLSREQSFELVAFAQLPGEEGLVRKVDDKLYTLDKNKYITGINSADVVEALGYTPYDDTNPDEFATVQYVDNAITANIRWLFPAEVARLIGYVTSPPGSPLEEDSYFVGNGAASGAWSSFSTGDLVQYYEGTWQRVLKASEIEIGMNFLVQGISSTTPVNSLAGKEKYVATITGGVGGDPANITFDFLYPEDNHAIVGLFINKQAFLFDDDNSKWNRFFLSNDYIAGDGLSLSNSTFNINPSSSIAIVADKVKVDLYSSGGLMHTENGTSVSSSDNAQLSLTKTGISPGTYTKITADAHGRIVGTDNPTTLAGYNILDAAPKAAKYVVIGGNDSTLTDERSLLGTANQINITDNGANSSAVLTISNNPIIPGTARVLVPKGTTAQRPATPTNGDSRYNTTENCFEYFENGIWVRPTRMLFYGSILSSSSGTTRIAANTSTPVNTTGTQLWSKEIIPRSIDSVFLIQCGISVDTSSEQVICVNLFRDTVYIGGVVTNFRGSGGLLSGDRTLGAGSINIQVLDVPLTTSPVTYQMRIGNNTGTWYVNRRSNENTYGGIPSSWYIMEKY